MDSACQVYIILVMIISHALSEPVPTHGQLLSGQISEYGEPYCPVSRLGTMLQHCAETSLGAFLGYYCNSCLFRSLCKFLLVESSGKRAECVVFVSNNTIFSEILCDCRVEEGSKWSLVL